MENVFDVAGYICERYKCDFGNRIDEMKLHKLLYFAQRESIIQTNEPLFDATFYGWKFGPILKEVRDAYKNNSFAVNFDEGFVKRVKPVMDRIFSEYAGKASWSLSRLTHGELSWKNSRIGISDADNSDLPMNIVDIMADADRVRSRRKKLGVS